MSKPRIRHIALNVQNRDEQAEYYKRIFGLEEKYRGPNGTVYLSDGFVGIALISGLTYAGVLVFLRVLRDASPRWLTVRTSAALCIQRLVCGSSSQT